MNVVVFIRYNFKKDQVSWEKINNVTDEIDVNTNLLTPGIILSEYQPTILGHNLI